MDTNIVLKPLIEFVFIFIITVIFIIDIRKKKKRLDTEQEERFYHRSIRRDERNHFFMHIYRICVRVYDAEYIIYSEQ